LAPRSVCSEAASFFSALAQGVINDVRPWKQARHRADGKRRHVSYKRQKTKHKAAAA
jgi:hypothetical protein